MSLAVALAMLAAAALVTIGAGLAIAGGMVLAWARDNRLVYMASIAGIGGGIASFIAGMAILAGNLQ
ncbi:hypothetical protein OMP43_03930 [Sphingomonas sp. CBMAI 2297]|uniref:hypothetical protein n=1 Tax=Sphingomonas sp. CBMAI 2297 TaxID=2991720 RepID=UPI0024570C72|nr:hypothetical protein [Sphingomonas sp. CBMAI 2297]MDH4743164.1 hypothetical protein [Sphingomonas sp. CBMAI 2297]